MYDAQGIQQEGRLFEVVEEIGVKQTQRGKGEGGKIGKNQTWKHAFNCQNCGKLAAGRSDGANRFCCNDCQQQWTVARWFNCSVCHARLGVGQKKSARILSIVHDANIGRQWRAKGIIPDRPGGRLCYDPSERKRREEAMEQARKDKIYKRLQLEAARITHKMRIAMKPKPDWVNYYQLDAEQRKERNKRLHKIRKEKMKSDPAYRAQRAEQSAKWKEKNKDKVRKWMRDAMKKRRRTDPGFKVMCNLRHRFKEILGAVRRAKASGFSGLTGCTTFELRAHLESQFKSWMTWDNYGTRWHVDHIIPCAAFDHLDPKQRAQCWHYTNLRPLCAKKNMAKSDTIEDGQLALLLSPSMP